MNRLSRILFSFLVIGVFWMGLSTHSAFAASCPVTDGGAGDGDGSANGTITINANTTWTPADATTWDCSGKTVLVTNNATLTFASDTTNGYYGWLTADSLTIDSGSTISSNTYGCAPSAAGTYNGLAPNDSNICTQDSAGSGDGSSTTSGTRSTSGGGYGGPGGDGEGGAAFNGAESLQHHTFQSPLYFGSSGGSHTTGTAGTGGGIVRLTISGTFTNNGTVSSNGSAAPSGTAGAAPGGGSGGSVYVDVGVLAGATGTFSATGGAGYVHSSSPTTYGGGGGGGRIAIYYTSKTMTLADATFSVVGGSNTGSSVTGGEGTVYTKNNTSGVATSYGGFGLASTTTYSETTWVFDSGISVYCTATITAPTISATTLTLAGSWSCADTGMTNLYVSASSAFTVESGTTMSFTATGADVDFNIPAGSSQTWTDFSFTGAKEGLLTIDDAISLSLAGTTNLYANAQFTALTNLTIASTASIDADGLGCRSPSAGTPADGYAPNASNVCIQGITAGGGDGSPTTTNTRASGGGAHGGAGGPGVGGIAFNGVASIVYDSSTLPVRFGASGGSLSGGTGGAGGGYIQLLVSDTLSNEGRISVDGGPYSGGTSGVATGGGSGGTIYIDAITYTNTAGTLSAIGGDGRNSSVDGGGGGGGRVAIYYITDTNAYLAGLVEATVVAGGVGGASNSGSTGSLYLEQDTTPGPVMTAATTSDTDNDGQIDAIVVTLDKDVTAGSVSGADFTATSFTVASASRTASAQITIVLTESGAGDTGATPTVTIVGSITDTLGHTTSSGAQASADGVAPLRLSQSYKDVVSVDGTVDRVDVLYSEALTLDECDSADYTFGGADLGSIVLGSCAVSTTTLQLTVTGAPANDTNLALTLDYTAGAGTANSIHDAANNNAATYTGATLADAAAPVAVSASYKDIVSVNGTVDRVDVVFSEAMTLSSYNASDWSFPGAGSLNLADTGASASTSTILVTVSADTGETSSTSTPTVLYTNNAGRLTDGTNAVATFGSNLNVTDSAAPAIRTVTIEETGTANGLIDKITILWSENIDTDDSAAPVLGDFGTILLPDGSTVSSATISDPAGASASVVLTSVVGQATANTAAGSTAVDGITTQWTDGTNATSNPDDAESITDSAAPAALSASYKDVTSVDGMVDRVDILFSETLDSFTYDSGDWSFTTAGDMNLAPSSATVSTSTLRLAVTADALETGSAVTPTVLYTNTGNRVKDSLSNATATFGSAMNVTDGASGFLITTGASKARYLDNDLNGRVDRVQLNFTEIVTISYTDSDWTAVANGLTSFDVGAYLSGSNSTSLLLTATAAVNLTGVSGGTEPTLAFSGATGYVRDAAGNAITFSATTLVDAAAAIPTAFSYRDVGGDAQVDRIDITFTEQPVVGDCAPSDYTIGGGDMGIIAVGAAGCAVSGSDLLLTVTGAPANTTALTLTLAYSASNGTANSLKDATTVAIASFGPSELTDGTSPIRLSQRYVDATGSDGIVDRFDITFSEPITVDECEAGDFTVSGADAGSIAVASCASSTNDVRLTLTGTSVGTGLTLNVAYTQAAGVANSLHDATGNNLTDLASAALTDGAAPVRLSQSYKDIVSVNGTVDRVDVLYSEALTLDECDSADYTFGGADLGSIVLGSCAVSTTTLQLTITGAPANDTNLALTLGYTSGAGTANSLNDGTNNAATYTGATLADGAAPIAISAAYKDVVSVNGTVDRVDVLFSEAMTLSSYSAGDWSFPAAGSLNLSDSEASASSSTILLTVSADTGETSSTSTPTVLYTNVGGRLTDAIGNAVATFGSNLNVTDSAAPAIRTVTIEETGAENGLIDKITILWSEILDTDDSAAPVLADFGTILLPDGQTVSSATISDPAGASASVVLTSITGQVTPNTAAGSTAIDGITTQWTDGTNATSNPDDAESITDSAAPFLRTDGSNAAAYQDNNADGTIDRAKLVFTESTTLTYADADWTATANNLTSFDVSGISSGNNSSTIYLTASAASNLTGVGSGTAPTLAFTAGTGSIVDGSTNALASISSRSLVDAASPLLLSNSPASGATEVALTADVVLTFSEAINTASDAVSLSEIPSDLASVWSSGDTVLTLTHTDPFTDAATITVTVTTAADATGNAFGGGDTGVTHPFSFTIVLDGAGPVLQSGVTCDTDADGHLDCMILSFNEDVDGATVAGVDFTVTGYTVSSGSRTSSATVTLVLTELVSYDTSAVPSTSLVGSITDIGGNATTSGTITPTDASTPIAISASYKDTNVNGTVDRVDVLFSEAMTLSSYSAGDWSFPGAGSLNLADSAAAASSSTIQVAVSADTGETSSTSTPTVLYTNNGNLLKDASNNAVATFGSNLNVTDSAAPAIRTITTEDTGTTNGLIDKITILWSENLDTDDGSAPVLADFGTILLPDGQSVSSATISDPAGASASVILTSVAGQVTPNTAAGSTAIDGITTQWTDGTNATSNPDDAESITDSAAPFLRTDGSNAAAYQDNNADGTVDRVKLVFTESTTMTYSDADWTATANNLTSFDVSGISSGNNSSTIYLTASAASNLTGVGSGTQPSLAFTAGTGSIVDGSTNAKSSISSFSLADKAGAVVASITPAEGATDVAQLANVVVVFSEKVDTSTAAYTWSTTPSGISEAWSSGDTTLTISHTGEFISGEAMTFTMTTMADLASNALAGADNTFAFTVITVRNPTLVSGSTADNNANGYIDRVVLVISEDIIEGTVAGSDFTVAGYTVSSASRTADSQITIVLTEGASVDTSARPVTTVVGSVSGSAGAITSGNVTPSDGAAPVRLSQSYKDIVSVNGTVDRVDVLYSEALTLDECDSADYTFGGADLGSIALGSCAVSTTTLQLTITGAPANDTNLALTLDYTSGAGTANSLNDGTNNAATYTGATLTDGAAPVAISAAYKDVTSVNGTVDRVDVLFSEAMTLSSYSAGDWSFPGAGSLNLADSEASASSSTILLTVSADTGETSSTSTPTVLYTNAGGRLTDAIGNAVATFGSNLNVTDSAAPAIRTVTIEETGTANGLIDKITILWSENIDTDDSAAPVLADFGTILLPDGSTVSSATISDPAGASASVVLTSVVGQVTPNTAAGSTAINGITTQWTDGTNATSNPDDAESITDSAAPIARSAAYYDSITVDGTVDYLTVLFTEAVTVVGCEVDDYDFGGTDSTSAGILNCNGSSTTTLEFELSGVTASDTNPDLTLAYLANNGIANSVTDTIGNALASFASFAIDDEAAPYLLTGISNGPRYLDENANGTVDALRVQFTESVDLAFDASNWVETANNLTSLDITGLDREDGSSVYLDASAQAQLTGVGSGTEPKFSFTPGGSGSIQDTSGNTAIARANVTIRDGAAPIALTASALDTDLDGEINRIDVSFTEVIAYDECEAGDYSFSGADSAGAAVSACAFATNEASFTMTGATSEDTALSANLIYDKDAGVAGSLDDGSSNFVPDFDLNIGDEAAPHLSSMTIQDSNADGFIDVLVFAWSENVDRVDSAAPVLANFGTITLPDGQTVSAGTASDPAGASSQITMSSVTGQTLRKMVLGSTAISGLTTGWWDGVNETSNPDEGVSLVDDATDIVFHNTVVTVAADELSLTSARMNGNVTDLGMSTITAHGFQYGHTTSYGSDVPVTLADGFTVGTYLETVSTLTCGTTYHFRAYATNTEGTSYGEDATFSTTACPVTSGGSAGPSGGAGGGAATGSGQSSGAGSGSESSSGFVDTEGIWSETYIEKLVESCGVEGYEDEEGNLLNEFRPNGAVTRAEAIKIMVGCERFKTKTPNKILTFKDVEAEAWYAPYMEVAYEKSWLQGYEDNTCKPNASAAREEAVKMVVEAAYKSPDFEREDGMIFKDVKRGFWYTKFIEFAAEEGIVSGYQNKDGKDLGIFGVGDGVTRAEFAKIVVEAFGL